MIDYEDYGYRGEWEQEVWKRMGPRNKFQKKYSRYGE
jgi:hypothetical protein